MAAHCKRTDPTVIEAVRVAYVEQRLPQLQASLEVGISTTTLAAIVREQGWVRTGRDAYDNAADKALSGPRVQAAGAPGSSGIRTLRIGNRQGKRRRGRL